MNDTTYEQERGHAITRLSGDISSLTDMRNAAKDSGNTREFLAVTRLLLAAQKEHLKLCAERDAEQTQCADALTEFVTR